MTICAPLVNEFWKEYYARTQQLQNQQQQHQQQEQQQQVQRKQQTQQQQAHNPRPNRHEEPNLNQVKVKFTVYILEYS